MLKVEGAMKMFVQITVPFLIREGDLHRDSIGKIAPFGMGGGVFEGSGQVRVDHFPSLVLGVAGW